MSKKKNAELSRMWGFAGKRHWLTIASCILAGISTVLSIIPFVCIWFVIRDILYAMKREICHWQLPVGIMRGLQ